MKNNKGLTAKEIDWIRSEIHASMVIHPRNEGDIVHNKRSGEILEIIDKYVKGKGLFQVGTEFSIY